MISALDIFLHRTSVCSAWCPYIILSTVLQYVRSVLRVPIICGATGYVKYNFFKNITTNFGPPDFILAWKNYTIKINSLYCKHFLFYHGTTAHSGPSPPHYLEFTIIPRYTTFDGTPLDEWSARRRDTHLTTYNTHKKYLCLRRGSKPQFQQASELHIHVLDRAATRTGNNFP